ncbi:50S ribosomal protein L27-like [Gigantopelta aegis]|uniref:50S ribosomal protein L27-like n=1 Tax=Gigantopelta aegis TaxID=1735272 RepID=UPI001B88B651|nr:50S ribosomal protein L27-like [Gigantopelta aegis]
MAASIARVSSSLLSNFSPGLGGLISVRFAKPVRNKRKRTKGKHRKIYEHEGTFVHAGQVLAKQLGLRFYPGENVKLGRDNTLYAITDGKVLISAESLSPYPDSPLYGPVQNGLVIKKKFIHVLCPPLLGKFRLVSQI